MPAKWQQWMPLDIDAFRGSPSVQAMGLAALGYLYLLMSAWQTEDCTIPSDPIELAEMSGLGDELWAVHGPRLLRKFERSADGDRLRNLVLYEKWKDARRIYERRSSAADHTNASRSPSRKATVTVTEASRSADTHAHVPARVPVPVVVSVEPSQVQNLPPPAREDQPPIAEASWVELGFGGRLCEDLGVVADGSTRRIAAESVRMLAAEGGTAETAFIFILEAGKQAVARGEVINRFWFTDQRYRPQAPRRGARGPDVPVFAQAPPPEATAAEDVESYRQWESMSPAYREANPWAGPVPTGATA